MPQTATLGVEFANALGAKDFDTVRVLTFLVEQQVFISEREGRIGWMRSVCSGYRPVAA